MCCSLALAQGAPGTAPSGTGGAASSAAMPGASASASGSTRKAASAKQADAKPIRELEAAAQRLRDAIHAMAQTPAGPRRT
ncbi:hypothetical protein [Azohydromonas lata]|uniref:hypothetical protein n=1 Tax=Azohydromonas lata TaxID=45677 RepID=UPI00083485EA|nr:hypothetical protein [Azohydromonas lata]